MKKIFALILAAALAATMLFTCTAMAEKVEVVYDDALTLSMNYPEGYDVTTTNMEGVLMWLMVAQDETAPNFVMMLTVSEEYPELERLNDLTEEELQEMINNLIEDLNNPTASVVNTGLGSKVIVIDEQGAEDDLVILESVYHGYDIVMYVGHNDGSTITVADLQAAMQIHTDMDFIESK